VSLHWGHDDGHRVTPALIDVTVPNAARAFDFLYGGRDNFAADRKAAADLVESAPSMAAVPAAARAFRRRVVRYFAADAGIRQFLEVGDGMVPSANTHEVAQAIDATCRIVYVESDPMMVDRMRATLASAPGGLVACVEGDVGDVSGIVSAAGLSTAGLSLTAGSAALAPAPEGDPADVMIEPGDNAILDPGRPIAVLLPSTLAHVPSAADAAKVVAELMDSAPSGSYLAIHHLASDLDPALGSALKQWNAGGSVPIVLRSRPEITAIVAGLDLVPPGLVPVSDWRPDAIAGPAAGPIPVYGLVARKP
jgi:S-adenosyl methyltransferase